MESRGRRPTPVSNLSKTPRATKTERPSQERLALQYHPEIKTVRGHRCENQGDAPLPTSKG
jgi:hypothetical protein